MEPTTNFETLAIPDDQLAQVTGGNIGQIASSIGGLVDQFAGTGGQATQVANQIGGLVGSFAGG